MRVLLHAAPSTEADVEGIGDWLRDRVDSEVEVRPRFLDVYNEGLAERLASARVLSPYRPETGSEMLGVLRYEERALENPERAGGVLYDGFVVQRAFHEKLAREGEDDVLHVVFLDRVLATWGNDGRWHKRVAVHGEPSLISVPGLYEAPAKPRSYYKEKQKHALISGDAPPREVLENEVEGSFLVEDDPRTTEALKGYALQAVHYYREGDAFCSDPECRLFDAHTQEDVVEAQLRMPEFCGRHMETYG